MARGAVKGIEDCDEHKSRKKEKKELEMKEMKWECNALKDQ
jgi:hypothetical protein